MNTLLLVLTIPIAVSLAILATVRFAEWSASSASWRASSGRCPSLNGNELRCRFRVGHKGPHCGYPGDNEMYTLRHWHDASSAVDALMSRVESEVKKTKERKKT